MNRLGASLLALALLLAGTLPLAAAQKGAGPKAPPAGEEDNARHYARCMALAQEKPTEGWEESLAWAGLGGGAPAKHCGAVALIGLKQYGEAATRLENLARTGHEKAGLRAGMLAQAGQAWLLEGAPERAYAAQTAALALTPGAPDLLVDRAETQAALKNYKGALADLDQALAGAPNRADALVFRAAAKRYLDDLKGARIDIDRALAIAPTNADGWLESGILKRLSGDKKGARADWMKVLDLAPDSPAGDVARRNMELLDVSDR